MSSKSKSSSHSSMHSSERRSKDESDGVLRAAQCLFDISRERSTGTVGGPSASGAASSANSRKRQSTEDGRPEPKASKKVARKTCSKCLKSFDTERERDEHNRTCKKRYKCNECNYVTPYLSHHERHKSTHIERKCPNCPKTFFSRNSFLGHIKTKHQGQSGPSNFACNECGKTYNMQNSLQRHIRQKHLTGTGQFRCQHCERTFYSEKGLELHMAAAHRELTTKETIRCEICRTEFSRRHDLTRHMRSFHQR